MVADQWISPPENLGHGSSSSEFCWNKPPVLSSGHVATVGTGTSEGRPAEGENGRCRRKGVCEGLRARAWLSLGRGFLGAGLPAACLCSPGNKAPNSEQLLLFMLFVCWPHCQGQGAQGPAAQAWPLNARSPSVERNHLRTICKGENSSCRGVRCLASGLAQRCLHGHSFLAWVTCLCFLEPLKEGREFEVTSKSPIFLTRLQETSNG